MELNRRSFLKGAAMTAVGAVGATALAGCAPSNASDQGTATADGEAYNTAETMQRKWSFEIPPSLLLILTLPKPSKPMSSWSVRARRAS